MAKKKDQDLISVIGQLILVIVIISIVLVQSIPILAPPICAICALVFFLKYKLNDIQHVNAGFKLSESEIHNLQNAARIVLKAKDKLEECERIIQEEGLHRCGNGRLDRRIHKQRADDVQGAIDEAMNKKGTYLPIYQHYKNLPMDRYNTAKKDFSLYWACFISFIVWFICFIPQAKTTWYFHISNAKGIIHSLLSSKKEIVAIEEPFISLWWDFWIMLIVFIIVLIVARIKFSRNIKEPTKE